MKILLAAGVFFPDVGGPAIHVRKIAERLSQEGFDVQVVAYGDDPSHTRFDFKIKRVSRKLPKFLQWLYYLLLVLIYAPTSKVIYAFDPTAAGVPARIAALIFRKPFLIRIGGDPIWEREAEAGRRLMPIEKYYEDKLFLKDKPVLYKMIRWVLSGAARIIVYNQNFKDFYIKYFQASAQKITIIKNPAFRREAASLELSSEPVILFAGRFVAYKNLERVIEAWKKVGKGKLLFIGSGPEKGKLGRRGVEVISSLPQERLFEEIRKSAICIGPALSEFNPNFILEALSFGKPVLLSKGHGLSVDLPEEFLFDPFNVFELEVKMRALLEPEGYKRAVEAVSRLPLNQSWDDVTSAHLEVVKDIMRQ